ncbi:MAG: hypothetical protein QOH99_784, partial [Frankiaceae bacterium]|nr:hypothetical protein [Frankiaceae bacterium]
MANAGQVVDNGRLWTAGRERVGGARAGG